MDRAPDYGGEARGELERALARVASVERERAGRHGRGQPAAHDHAALGDPDEGRDRGTEGAALRGDAAAAHEYRVGRLRQLGELDVGLALTLGELGLQPRRVEPL